jgi:hypothetical protein
MRRSDVCHDIVEVEMKSGFLAMTIGAVPLAIVAAVLPLGMTGCAVATDENGEVAPEGEGDLAAAEQSADPETEKLCGATRADWTATAYPGDGLWGSWGCVDWCPPGSYAYGANSKIEGRQYDGDDTALNGFRLYCYRHTDRINSVDSVTSSVGPWGSWQGMGSAACWDAYKPIASVALRTEGSQGTGDDTSVNALKIGCGSGSAAVANPNPTKEGASVTPWGAWGAAAKCPAGSAVCGIQTRLEGDAGSHDDTTINGARFYCCSI